MLYDVWINFATLKLEICDVWIWKVQEHGSKWRTYHVKCMNVPEYRMLDRNLPPAGIIQY